MACCEQAHRRQVAGQPDVLIRRTGWTDIEAGVVDRTGQPAAADGLVRGQHDRVHQAEFEPGSASRRPQPLPQKS